MRCGDGVKLTPRYRRLGPSRAQRTPLSPLPIFPIMADLYQDLKDIVDNAEGDFQKFYEKGNKAAGTRIRKAMQEIKAKAQEIRSDVQDKKNAA